MGKKIVIAIGVVSMSMLLGCTGDVTAVDNPQAEPSTSIEDNTDLLIAIEDGSEEKQTIIPEKKSEAADSENKEDTLDEDTKVEPKSEDASEETSVESKEQASLEQEEQIKINEASMELYVKKNVNIRKGPGTDYDKLGTLNKGDKVKVNGIAENNWYRFDYNGNEAFVSDKFLIDETAYTDMIAKEEEAARQAQEEQTSNPGENNIQTPQTENVASTGNVKADVVAIMNAERAANGVAGIVEDASLDALAQIRAEEIVSTFDHTRPNGTSCFTVLDEGGVVYMAAGENIAAGQSSAKDVMNSWMNSSGHRANILNGGFGRVGIGYVQGGSYGTYWVQIFTN